MWHIGTWSKPVLGILFNCCEPEAITLALARIRADADLVERLGSRQVRLGAYANRLTPVDPDWTLETSDAPQPFRKDVDEQHYWDDFVRLWIHDLGVQIVGGCCGITPEHIAYIQESLKKEK